MAAIIPGGHHEPAKRSGGHDPAVRRRGQAQGREAGCWVYITADMLKRAGYDTDDGPVYYRVWAGARGRVVVQLYREQ